MEDFSFADDAPRTDLLEDDFRYRPFAERLAAVLHQLDAPRGYVVGLHGEWGSGKTTALNFTTAVLKLHNRGGVTSLEPIWFQPWMFSGQQDLISAYFRVLAENLRDLAEKVAKAKKAARGAVKAGVDPLVKAAVTVAVSAHPSDKVAIETGGEVVKRALDQTVDAWLGEPTLQAAHDDLARRLKKSGRRFLVIIDDLDRLEPAEIRSMMQMVKSVGRLPNVIYLLAYDRRIVWRSLGERDARQAGEPTFAEKIIQHEVELPLVSRRALMRRLDKELKFVLPAVEGGLRWQEIISKGIHRWICRPRDIVRFSNSLRFSWPPLKGEVDPADVIAMEGVRLFEPKVFEWIRRSRHFLIEGPGYVSEAENKEYAEAFRQTLPAADRESVMELLATLFASRSKYLLPDNRFRFGETWADAVSRGGIAAARGFDAYFALFPSEFTLSRQIVEEAAASPDDADIQGRALRTALEAKDEDGRSLVATYIEDLQYRLVSRRGLKPTPAMIEALVQQAYLIQAEDNAGAFLNPYVGFHMLIRDMLERFEPDVASATLVAAVEHCASAAAVASLYVWRARELGVLPDEGSRAGPVINEATLSVIGARAMVLIRAEAEDGRLMQAPFYWDILQTWAQLEGLEVARAWLEATYAADPRALVKVTRGILTISTGIEGRDVYAFRGFHAERDFYDPDKLLMAAEKFADHAELTDDGRDRIIALRDGLRARAAQNANEADAATPDGTA